MRNPSGLKKFADRKRILTKKKLAAVVVPVYKSELTADEEKSLCRLERVLSKHDRFILKPDILRFSRKSFLSKNVKPNHLDSINSYSQFLLTEEFYRLFEDYEYILIHQLDCLVFSDRLTDWCGRGYDYIGAPWFVSPELPWLTQTAVGNGGFSLRNVKSSLRVLRSFNSFSNKMKRLRTLAYRFKREVILNEYGSSPDFNGRFSDFIKKKRIDLIPGSGNEDLFWAFEAKKYYPTFNIPDPLTALEFSFEVNPRACWEANKRRMPFGCHAWTRYDRAFWEERIAEENE